MDIENEQPADVVLWPDANTGPWMLRPDWAIVDGRQECVGLSIRSYRTHEEAWAAGKIAGMGTSSTPGLHAEPLTGQILRSLPVASIVRRLRKADRLATMATYDKLDAKVAGKPELEALIGSERATRKAEFDRPAERGPITRQGVADVYLAAWNADEAPLQAVRDRFRLTKSAAAKQVQRAREAGLLPPTTRGRARGEATK